MAKPAGRNCLVVIGVSPEVCEYCEMELSLATWKNHLFEFPK